MNFFFGLKHELFKCEIQIPKFQNKNLNYKNLKLIKCFPSNNQWNYEIFSSQEINDEFYIINEKNLENKDLFFLAYEEDKIKFNLQKLKDINNFTDTSPAYRSNLKLYINDGGFSSYQSEYPSGMISKFGSILSPLNSLTNVDAEKNYIIFRNVFEDAIEKNFKGYFINYKNKMIEKEIILKTNNTNIIDIDKDLIKPEIFFFTVKYLGIPIFLSLKKKHLSFEHTHPPHSYIYSENKFELISKIKKEFNEIVNKKNS
jgi:hypothetical protein